MSFKTVKELAQQVAQRARQARRQAKLTQEELAERADLPLSTYKRFEQKGLISFESLIKVAFALRAEDGLDALFAPRKNVSQFKSLAEVEKALSKK